MVDVIARFTERKTGVRLADRATWPDGWLQISFKSLKRNPVFEPLLDNDAVLGALDAIFGAGGWKRPNPGAQVLLSFPDASEWVLPHDMWHSDWYLTRPTRPTPGVKLFACIGEMQPRGGATLALSGSHRLVSDFAATLTSADEGHGGKPIWRRFFKHYPALGDVIKTGAAGDVDGVPVEVVEMCGSPGDVFITHLHVFHSPAPNANDVPRLMLGKAVMANGEA